MTAGPTPAECEALVDHVLVVGISKQRSQVAPELVPTAAQVAAIRAELVVEMVPACVAYPRPVFACAMAAVTTDAVVACSLDAP